MFESIGNFFSGVGDYVSKTLDWADNSNTLKYASNFGNTWLEGELAIKKASIENEGKIATAESNAQKWTSLTQTAIIFGGLIVLVLLIKD